MGDTVAAAESALRHPFHIGDFTVDPVAGVLGGPAGREQLDPKVMEVLVLLAQRAGTLVRREDLLERIWPGVVVSDDALTRCIYQLRRHFVQAGGDDACKALVQTFPRRGYQLNCPQPVASSPISASGASTLSNSSVGASDFPPSPTVSHPPSATAPSRKRWFILAAGLGAILLLAVLLRTWLPDDRDLPAGAVFNPPSIAVLPFVNISSDQENEHFSDGLTEELINRLAGIRGLKVVARTSSFRFKGEQEAAPAMAQALQVSHILEGSVRRSGARLRISAQLIDARRDTHVWSETFDRELGDIFQIQEDIAFAVAAALKVSLFDADEFRVRRHGTADAEAYRLYLIGHAHLLGRTRSSDQAVAKRSLEAAIERDPNFAAAHAALSRLYLFYRGPPIELEERERLGTAAAERAVALDATLSDALQARANFGFWRYQLRGHYEDYVAGHVDMQRAIELDPANSLAFEDYGRGVLWHEPDLATGLLDRAIQLDLLCTSPNFMIAMLLGARGQLDAARKRCTDLLERAPDAAVCAMAIGTLETYFGRFEPAIDQLQGIEKDIGATARLLLWSVHMSMGDRTGAQRWLDFGNRPGEKPLSDAARLASDGRYDQALAVLERYRVDFPHDLNVPAAKLALIVGNPQQALEILEQRFPDLAGGIEPVHARNLLPAVDLATALSNTGAHEHARALLERIAAYLDGPGALRLPMFTYQRARMHALAGEPDAAVSALDQAYDEGLRTTWALDLRPQDFRYIDPIEADPALAGLRNDPRLARWFDRIRADNARQLAQLGSRETAEPID